MALVFTNAAIMASKLKFIFLYLLGWVLLFDLLRAVFLLYHYSKTSALGSRDIAGSFFYGLRMDLSVAAYVTIPVILFALLALAIPLFRKQLLYKWYTFLVLLIIATVALADLEIYKAWGFRIDSTPLKFLGTPREAFASISHLPLVLIGIVFIAVSIGLFFLSRVYLRRIFFREQNRGRIVTAIVLLVLAGSMIIPIRGGLQLAPLNQSSVYFSTNNFANHAAINASWNFIHSLFSKGNPRTNPYKYNNLAVAQQQADSLFRRSGENPFYVRFDTAAPTNVILIIWESFTQKAVDLVVDGKEVTPGFNKLLREGIYFTHMYASGDRTNKGIPAILSGYPAMPNTTIIHSPNKSVKLNVLSQTFAGHGYSTPFFYGGEPEFANIKSYLLHGGFNPIIGRDDFAAGDMNSKWGAHDGIVATRVLNDLNKTKQPFFATWLTLSSHEPFETPVPVVIKGKDNTAQFLNSLHYADQSVADFIANCKKQDWWKNTLVVITGDHGHPLPETGNKVDEFRIPMLWLGGALTQDSLMVDKIMSQLDIPITLMGQAGWKNGDFPYSKDALDPEVRPWAFFTFNNGFGYVDSSGTSVFDNVGKRLIGDPQPGGERRVDAGKALMQVFYEDFLRK